MTMHKLAWMALAGAAILVSISSATVAKVLVVRSLGPSAKAYPPGKALADTSSIKLNSGDSVTLLGPSTSRTLRGPGTFSASTTDRSSLASAAGRRSRFGAMRSGEITTKPGLWDVDVTQSGKMCIAEPAKLKLWRPNADTPATLSVSGGPSPQSIAFAEGHATVPWPAELPVADGGQYQLQWAGGGDRNTVSFVMVKAPSGDLVDAAQLLIDKGCQNQLDLLISSADKGE
ncbi:MAG: hypothetical protein ABIO69_04600 [Sphingomicrobium sp.]